jgi:hypothetical protein
MRTSLSAGPVGRRESSSFTKPSAMEGPSGVARWLPPDIALAILGTSSAGPTSSIAAAIAASTGGMIWAALAPYTL